jgi:hypothetical protein
LIPTSNGINLDAPPIINPREKARPWKSSFLYIKLEANVKNGMLSLLSEMNKGTVLVTGITGSVFPELLSFLYSWLQLHRHRDWFDPIESRIQRNWHLP